MAESDEQQKVPSLAEEWSLPQQEQQPLQVGAPVAQTAVEKPTAITSAAGVEEKTEEVSAANENAPAAEESNAATEQETGEATEATETVEVAETETEAEEVAEEKPEIKIETAPADFRFPTTNQTRHCFTRYIEYHRCIAAKGEDASECNKFAKYYRALCPGEWVDRWNEQRENGTFPGPL